MKHTFLSLLTICSVSAVAFIQPAQAETLIVTGKEQTASSGATEPRAQSLIIKDGPYTPKKYEILSPSDLPKGKGYLEEENQKIDRACLKPNMNPIPFNINPGDMLSGKLIDWAKSYGYELLWDGDDLRANGTLNSDKGMTETLTDIKQAMELNGINLEITTYTNCVVRVVEVQEE